MSKADVLFNVQRDLAANDLGKARDRLLGLIGEYPNDLELRARLAKIYSLLRYPDRAGCYWYLEEKKTRRMKAACAAFERRCGNKPRTILDNLRFKGSAKDLDPYAAGVLNDLRKRAALPPLGSHAWNEIELTETKIPFGKALIAERIRNGCIVAFVLGLFVIFGTGAYTITAHWIPRANELLVDLLTHLF